MRPSLWAQYCTELLGGARTFLETEWGFISYSFPQAVPNAVMIHDMYVIPEERRAGRGRELFDRVCWIGKEAGKTAVLAEAELSSKVFMESFRAQLAVGLVPIAADRDKILTRKEL